MSSEDSSRNAAIPVATQLPRLMLHVGVTGHRPNRIAVATDFLRNQCHRVLSAIFQFAAESRHTSLHPAQPPLIFIISSLAEGSDRIVASEGLALGAELESLLPFSVSEYERDFDTSASRAEFRGLLAQANVHAYDGRRGDAEAAYEFAGRAVIERSDILIAIWDAKPAAGRGGTVQMIEEAIASGVPVVWIHASEEIEPRLLLADESGNQIEQPFGYLASLFASLVTRSRRQRATSGRASPPA